MTIGSLTINAGDTLSQIAARVGSTVEALASANGISNPDLIYAGASLQVSGGQGGVAQAGVASTASVGGASAISGNNAGAIAEQFIGRNASELKLSSDIPMQDWVPNNVNCANFVSGCLELAGVIDPSQSSASVDQLANNLRNDGWRTTSLENARPGDVVLMQQNGQSHVVLFAGFKNGEPAFIGSNNINADGSQQVSWGGASGNYEIITKG